MITLWHNPRCSKSRATLALIEAAGVSVNIRKYLDDVPDVAELNATLIALGYPSAHQMMRTGEKIFKELGLSAETSDAALFAAMAANPNLIERPIAFKDKRAVIGRPPEAVAALL